MSHGPLHTSLTRNPQTPNMEYWSGAFTAVMAFRSASGRPVAAVTVMRNSAVALGATAADTFSWLPDANDASEFVLYGWDTGSIAPVTATTITIGIQTR